MRVISPLRMMPEKRQYHNHLTGQVFWLQTLEMGVTFMYLSPNSNMYPIGICLLEVNNRNTSTKCEICSKLTMASFGCLYC